MCYLQVNPKLPKGTSCPVEPIRIARSSTASSLYTCWAAGWLCSDNKANNISSTGTELAYWN